MANWCGKRERNIVVSSYKENSMQFIINLVLKKAFYAGLHLKLLPLGKDTWIPVTIIEFVNLSTHKV